MDSDLLLILVVGTALAFDFTNGFHDAANAMATSIATGALRPRVAVTISAVLNLVGAFISIEVATTIAEGIVNSMTITLDVIFAALLGAIAWNLTTWYFGLPSSSSHALIGGVIGATFVVNGADAINGTGIVEKVLIPALIAPFLAGAVAALGTVVAYKVGGLVKKDDSERGFKMGQIGSASLVSLAHGTNDAQKTMGVITLALVAHGSIDPNNFTVPLWVKLTAGGSIALGTYLGGWRIIRTLGTRLTKVESQQGFAAESSGATVILASSYFGYPLSTTQVVSGGVIGAGLGKRLASVHWGMAGRIAIAWILTIPAAAVAAAAAGAITDLGGDGFAVPALLAVAAIGGATLLFRLAGKNPVTADNVNSPT